VAAAGVPPDVEGVLLGELPPDELLPEPEGIVTVSWVLPRTDGSSTMRLREQYSTGVPFSPARVAWTVTFHRLGTLDCSASTDQFQVGSSSRGTLSCEERGKAPEATSQSLSWQISVPSLW
jgi:hypothetical protein